MGGGTSRGTTDGKLSFAIVSVVRHLLVRVLRSCLAHGCVAAKQLEVCIQMEPGRVSGKFRPADIQCSSPCAALQLYLASPKVASAFHTTARVGWPLRREVRETTGLWAEAALGGAVRP